MVALAWEWLRRLELHQRHLGYEPSDLLLIYVAEMKNPALGRGFV
jgi:hypothetical protein